MKHRRRKPTIVENDAKLIRDYLVEGVGSTVEKTGAVLAALDRLERRASGTSVHGENYTVHIDRNFYSNSTWCGRVREAVNYVTEAEATKSIGSGEYCMSCVKRYLRAKQ